MPREANDVKLHDSLESLKAEKCPEKREPKMIVAKDGSKKWGYVRSAEHLRSEYARQVHGTEVYPVESAPKAADFQGKIESLDKDETAKLIAQLQAKLAG